MTLLFADLSGSTAIQDQMDPESVRRWMDRYYAAMRAEIEAHGGRLVKFIGDGVMAAFGVPDVREDDARRALEAAVAMQTAFAALSADGDEPGGLRIGINTGEVVVTADDDDVVGDAVNVAARLEHEAGRGEIIVGEATFRLVRLTAELRALPPLELRGKAEPVQAFRLVSLDPQRDAGATTPFIGRASELIRLSSALDDAIKVSAARLVTIVGSPGVGKTRLARELAAVAATQARVIEMRCDPAGSATFAPIAQALRIAASLEDDASDETIVHALAALFDEDEPDRDRIATTAGALLGAGDPGQPEETFWAVRRLVENAARRRPIVLFFDDVHWAEPLLLDLIDNLAEWIRDAPVLLVMTARPELRDLRPQLVEEGGRLSAAIHLEGLGVDESSRLACELLGAEWLPAALLERLATASEGNPLFVGELVRMLVDDGVLQKEGDDWIATVDLASLDVPLTIHALLTARIDRLAAGERAVLEAASVVGKTFYRGAVAELVAPETRNDLDNILERLRRKELVEPAGTYWIDEPVYRFHHVLIQDAAYRRLLKDARADLHEGTAEWLEKKAGDLVEHDDVIGYQLEQSYLLRQELGTTDRAVGQRAADRLAAAGRRALEADDCVSAAGLLGRAIDCLDSDEPSRGDLLLDRCEALLTTGDVTAAIPEVERLTDLAVTSERLQGWVACFSAEIANLTSTGSLADVAARAAEAATQLAALGDVAGEAKAHAVRAASLARLGRIGECEASLDQALGAARRAGDRRRATAVLAGAPVAALWGPNPVTRASGRCLDVVRVLRITSRAPAVEATSLRCQAVLESLRGRADAGRRMLASARTALEELGNAHGLLELDIAAGMVESLEGQLADAELYLDRARRGFLELGIDADAAFAGALLADVLVAKGRIDEALQLTEESKRLGGDDLRTAIAWRSVRAEALVSRGQPDEARQLAEEAVALAEATDALVDHAKALASLARALRAIGDEPGARSAAQRALELYERKEASVLADQVRAFLGTDAPHGDSVSPAADDRSLSAFENAVTRMGHRVAAIVSRQDWDALTAFYAPDVVFRDHRPLMQAETHGRDEFVDHVRALVSLGVEQMDVRPLLLRGDRLALVGGSWRGATPEVEALSIYELGDDDQLVAVDLYDLDQLPDAVAELDRRYTELEPAEHAEAWAATLRWLAAINDRDFDALRSMFTDDFKNVDHRPVGWGSLDAEAFTRIYQNAFDLAPDARGVFPVVYELTPRGSCFRAELRGMTKEGAEFRTMTAAVALIDAGKIERIEFFAVDDLEGALAVLHSQDADEMDGAGLVRLDIYDGGDFAGAEARFAELSAAASPLESAATHLSVAAARKLLDHEWDALEDSYASDVVIMDHRAVVGHRQLTGRAEALVNAQSLAEFGVSSYEQTVLAVRGERLALVRSLVASTDADVELLELVEHDDSGRLVRGDAFDPEQIDAAFALLDERFLAGEGAGSRAWSAITRHVAALNARDWNALYSIDAEDFTVIDDRALGLGRLDRDEYVSINPPMVERAPDARWRVVNDVSVADDVACLTMAVSGSNVEGGAFTIPYHLVVRARDDTLLSIEVFDPAALDVAVARVVALTAAPAEAADRRFADLTSSSAWRVLERGFGHVNGRNLDGLRSVIAEDFVVVDHRPLGFGVLGRDDYVAIYPPMWEQSDDVSWSLTQHGSSGSVAFGHSYASGTNRDGGRFDNPVWVTTLERDGLWSRLEAFPTEEEARARFDVFTTSDARRLVEDLIAAMNARDWAALRDLTSDAITAVDHRPLSWGKLDREAYLALYPQLVETAPDARWRTTIDHRATRDLLCTSMDVRGSSVDGGEFEIPILAVVACRDGLPTRLEIFAEDDLAGALRRFDELAGTSAARLENAATRTGTRVTELALAGESELADALYAEDATHTDHRPGVGGYTVRGRRDILEAIRGITAVGVTAIDHDFIATRGDRLGLSRSMYRGEGGDLETVLVTEVDGDGRVLHVDAFASEQIDDALVLLDERFVATLDDPDRGWGPVSRLMTSIDARDLDAARRAVADDMAVHDHRPLGWGVIDAERFLGLFPPMYEQSPDARWTTVQDVRRSGDVVCMRVEITGTSREGGEFVIAVAPVMVARDGRVQRFENFALENLDDALARFDELVAEASARRGATNRATRVAETFLDAVVRRDVTGLTGQLAEDIVWRDGRALVGGIEVVGRDAAIVAAQGIRDAGVTDARWEHLAVRGQRLALSRLIARGSAAEVEILQVLELDASGRVSVVQSFDVDQLDAAVALLEEWFLGGEGAPYAAAWRPCMAMLEALNAGDWDALRDVLGERYVVLDHRPLGWEPGDRETWIELYRSTAELAHDLHYRSIADIRLAPGAVLVDAEGRGMRDGGEFVVQAFMVGAIANGRIQRFDYFAAEDLDAALARFDELVMLRPVGWVHEELQRRVVARDLDAIVSMYAPDAVLTDHRPLMGNRFEGDDLRLAAAALIDIGVTDMRGDRLAVRGDRLELRATTFAGPDTAVDTVQVSGIDSDHLVVAIDIFENDQLDEAFALLDERFVAGEGQGSDAWSTLAEVSASLNRRDLVGLRAVLDADLVVVDHRPLGWGTVDLEDWIALYPPMWERSDDVRWRMVRDVRVTDTTMCVRIDIVGSDRHGGDFAISLAAVMVVHDGLMTRMETFPVDELDAALARYDELSLRQK